MKEKMDNHTVAIFMLGMLSGVLLFYGIWMVTEINNRKSGVPKATNPPPPPSVRYSTVIEEYRKFMFDFYGITPPSIEDQLQNAIEREDYELAAKLRDQINYPKQ